MDRTRKPDKLPQTIPLYGTDGIRGFIVVALLPILFGPIIIYRWLLMKFAKYWRPDLSHILRCHGSFFLRNSVHEETNMNVILQFHLDGSPDIDEIKNRLLIALHKKSSEHGHTHTNLVYPELQQFCVKWGGYFFWKQEAAFKIEDHVLIRNLRPNEDIKEIQYGYLEEALPANKSPWQILIARSRGAESSHHILFKFHHTLADGYSMTQLLMELVDAETAPVCLKPKTWTAVRAGKEASGTTWSHWFTLPARIISVLSIRTEIIPPWPPVAPESMYAGGRKRHMYTGGGQLFQFSNVRQIAKRHHVCTSAVIYAALTGSLRKHLLSKCSMQKLPNHIKFYQSIPMPNHPPGLCLALAGVTYQLPIGEINPSRRLQACHQMIEESKQSIESWVHIWILNVRCLLPYSFPFLKELDSMFTYVSVSNLVGSLQPCRFIGRQILGHEVPPSFDPAVFSVVTSSYAGDLRWTCNADTRFITNVELTEIGEWIREEFEGLEACAIANEEDEY